MQCLLPKATAENANNLTSRYASALELLVYMADQNLPWTDIMSELLIELDGLTTILKHLRAKNEYQIAQAARICYYMISNKRHIKEVSI